MWTYSCWNIHKISVPLNFCAMNACSRGGGGTLASEQLDSAGFSVFMNRVNNYPGVAANSGDDTNSAWLQTSANKEKNLPNPLPNPLLSILLLYFSLTFFLHSVSLFSSSLFSVSFSLCCVNHLLCLPLCLKLSCSLLPICLHLFFFLFVSVCFWITEIHEQKIRDIMSAND